ncbi:MAG TPA: hypothetical protein DC000_07570 [Clostridiales bacterium]|nr:hypothetical protein [Clostridiales bacterium]
MFQTKNTGKKISQLRKEKNITQMELADLMGVSYQAVSNWERGNSMPDISKLPELAEILEVSIDDLLNDGKPLELVKNVINGTEDEFIVEEKISIDTVAEVAPLLKPTQTEKIVDKVIKENEECINFEDIIQIAPFLSEEKVDMLALNLSSNNMLSELVCLAPFMSRNALDDLALKSTSNGKLSDIIGLAPFLSRETLDKLATASFDNENLNQLVALAPFLSRSALNELALKATNKNDKKALMGLAPFLGRETLNKIVDDYVKNFGLKDIKNIIPFL